MQYALLIYGAEGRWEQFSEEEQQAMTEQYMAISRDPKTKGGADLGDLSKATTVQVDNGKTLTTDGPFAETKEYLGGFYLIEAVFREEWSRVLAILITVLGDFELAEDAVQDAIATALERWPRDGTPENPGAWLVATARNRAIDRIRRERTLARKTELLQRLAELETDDESDEPVPDERLSLIFTCCHPALAPEAQVALTLRAVGGLTTTEIARAFLVPEMTMGQRLVRAKRKIRDAGVPFRVPPEHLLPERLDAVFAVLYLVFNEGYVGTSAGRLVRGDLCEEAIRLAKLLA